MMTVIKGKDFLGQLACLSHCLNCVLVICAYNGLVTFFVFVFLRSHIQQITGAVTNMERRSGNVLPPPLDDCTSNTSGKPTVKNSSSVCISFCATFTSFLLHFLCFWVLAVTASLPCADSIFCCSVRIDYAAKFTSQLNM